MLPRLWLHAKQQQSLINLSIAPGLQGSLLYSTGKAGLKKPPISQKVKFVDQLRIVARGGHGGGGSSALFGRTGHHPRAAGGNGAPGGSVLLRATRQLTGLGSIPLHVEAGRGGHGGKQWMDGKKGADKVVPVPLGTMVWRLVQLRGQGADTPHGVTALPQTAATHQHALQHVQQAGAADVQGTSSHASHSQAPQAGQGQVYEHSVEHTGSQHRRRLFQDGTRLPAAGCVSAGALQAPEDAHTASEDSSSGSSNANSPAYQGTQLPNRPMHDAWAASGLCEGASEPARTDSQDDALYQDLISGRTVLSNKDKLHLLHYGSLEGPSAGGWSSGSVDSISQEESEADSSSEEGGEWEKSDSDSEVWDMPPQQDVSPGWRGLGEYGEKLAPHLTKDQVWAVLSAQAELLGVLETEGQELLVAEGGRGGRGNAAAPSQHQRPASKVRSDGQPGQEVLILLQLRLMADVALVGLPNVGKSSLIAALTGARAQVGSYAFTTLRPQLGTLLPTVPEAGPQANLQNYLGPQQDGSHRVAATGGDEVLSIHPDGGGLAAAAATAFEEDTGLTGHKLVLADLPGLVPGAHQGRGRGIDFLQHLQKARCIALVVDMTGKQGDGMAGTHHGDHDVMHDCMQGARGTEETAGGWEAVVPHSPEQQLKILLDELRSFDATALTKPMLVVASKVDAMSAQRAAAALQRLKAVTAFPIVPVSAQKHMGLLRLKQSLELLASR